MKSIMCLNEKSITNIPIAIMTEAIITMVALLLLCTGAAKAKDYHMGTYNIRCINATLTGLRDWDNRKEYVAKICLLYTSPSPRDRQKSRMPSSA